MEKRVVGCVALMALSAACGTAATIDCSHTCGSDSDCSSTEVCRRGICVEPGVDASRCPNALPVTGATGSGGSGASTAASTGSSSGGAGTSSGSGAASSGSGAAASSSGASTNASSGGSGSAAGSGGSSGGACNPPCGANQTCVGGTCVLAACVGVTCTGATVCAADGGCIPAAQDCTGKADGTPCDDQDPCTRGDACASEVCAGASATCVLADCEASSTCDGDGGCNIVVKGSGAACTSDSNPCTTDLCDPVGNCTHASLGDGASCGNGLTCSGGVCQGVCVIAGTTYASGDANPANACQSCQPGVSTSAWTNRANGASCDDGDACTRTDSCQGGACVGSNPKSCTASDACHAVGVCNSTTGVCSNPTQPDGHGCNDNNACTQTDVCTGGVCGGTAYACSPSVCQTASSCDGSGGCNVTDAANGTACGTGKVCSSGSCVADCYIGGTLYSSGAVNPSNACQVCTPSSSTTAWTTRSTGTSCASGKVCSGTSCVSDCYIGGTLYASGAADPANACKVCTPASSTTAWSNRGTSATCNDGNLCTSSDHCNGAGSCTGTAYSCTPTSCEASSTCDGNGSCNTTFLPDGSECVGGAPLIGSQPGPKPRLPTCQSVKCMSGVCQFGPGCPSDQTCINQMCQ